MKRIKIFAGLLMASVLAPACWAEQVNKTVMTPPPAVQPAAPVNPAQQAAREQLKALDDKERAEIQPLDAQIKQTRDGFQTKIHDLEQQLNDQRTQLRDAVSKLDDQKKTLREQYATQRDTVMDQLYPNYTEQRKEREQQIQALNDQEHQEIQAIDAQEKQEFQGIHEKYDVQRKAVREKYAAQRRDLQQSQKTSGK